MNRREFLRNAGLLAETSALSGLSVIKAMAAD